MEWLNLRTSTLRLPQYIGSPPIHRATWFNLLAYCVEQENGGKITEAMSWGDRQWQQTCGVTKGEVKAARLLVTIAGKDVLVWGYPHEKEREVQAKREAGKATAAKRWQKPEPAAPKSSTANGLAPSSPIAQLPLANSSATRSAYTEGEGEGEEEGEEEGNPPPSPCASRAELDATWTLILSVLRQKKRRAGYEAEHALSRQADHLPLAPVDAGALTWFYSLPHDERDIDLRARFRDADKLAINLFPALERAHAYAKKTGREKNDGPAAVEPAGWREWYAATYAEKPVPADFAELPDYLQDDCRKALKKTNGGAES